MGAGNLHMFVLINGAFGIGTSTAARVPASWCRLTVLSARWLEAVKTLVTIPMAFSNRAYLNEVCSGLAKSRRPVFHFCLTAPIEVVRERIATRGEAEGDP